MLAVDSSGRTDKAMPVNHQDRPSVQGPAWLRYGSRVRAGWTLFNHERWLRQAVLYAWRHSPFYRDRFKEWGVSPEDIRTIKDLAKLPFTTASDLARDPRQFLAVPQAAVQYIWETGGSTGRPKRAFFTRWEVRRLVLTAAYAMILRGVKPGDTAQICFAYGRPSWPIGSFLQSALEMCGVLIIPSGNDLSVEAQLHTIQEMGTNLLFCTPSYLHRLTEEGQHYADLATLGVRMITVGAEPLSESFRNQVEEVWGGATVFDSYGMIEMGNLIAGECHRRQGLHLSPDLIVEVIDPVSGELLPPNSRGELVYTPLLRKAMPLLRYRSGDLSRLLSGNCACRLMPTPRIDRILGRADDMTFLGTGENIYPTQFDEILFAVPGVLAYQLVLTKNGFRDHLLFRLEANAPPAEVQTRIVAAVYAKLAFIRHDVENSGVIEPLEFQFVPQGTFSKENIVKLKRFVDRRKES